MLYTFQCKTYNNYGLLFVIFKALGSENQNLQQALEVNVQLEEFLIACLLNVLKQNVLQKIKDVVQNHAEGLGVFNYQFNPVLRH